MGLKKNIQISALQILGVNISPQDSQWGQVSVLEQSFTPQVVLEAFEAWASSQKDRIIPYPLSEFIRIAPRLISLVSSETGSSGNDAALDDLCSDLYIIGGPAFSGRTREALGTLLKTYHAEEIKLAYTEFIASFDDFDMKQAPKKFAEGGGKTVLLAFQKRRELNRQQAEMIERTKQAMLEQQAWQSIEDEPITIELPEA